jgi:hypothetical protein
MDESEVPGKKKGFLGWSPERPHVAEAMLGIAGTTAVGLGNKSVGKQYWSGKFKEILDISVPGHVGTDLDISVLGTGHFGTDLDISVLGIEQFGTWMRQYSVLSTDHNCLVLI